MASYALQTPPHVAHAKPPGPTYFLQHPYWMKYIFSLGSFPEVGQKQKTEKKEREKERKKD